MSRAGVQFEGSTALSAEARLRPGLGLSPVGLAQVTVVGNHGFGSRHRQ